MEIVLSCTAARISKIGDRHYSIIFSLAAEDQNDEIDKLTDDLGVELWKYVAKKNANSSRRRGGLFIGAGSGCWTRSVTIEVAMHII